MKTIKYLFVLCCVFLSCDRSNHMTPAELRDKADKLDAVIKKDEEKKKGDCDFYTALNNFCTTRQKIYFKENGHRMIFYRANNGTISNGAAVHDPVCEMEDIKRIIEEHDVSL